MSGHGPPSASGRSSGRRSGRAIRFDVRRFEALDSTNRYLLDQARAGGDEGLVAVADHQSAGRGRLGRRWEAPAGTNLLLSVLLRPTLADDELHLCTVAVALAARRAVAAVAGVEADLKWPNDLLVAEKKVAGILAETIPTDPGAGQDRGRAVVVGLGLNVNWPAPEPEPATAASAASAEGAGTGEPAVPAAPLADATSLWRVTGKPTAPAAYVEPLLGALGEELADLGDRSGRLRLAADYRRACATVGRTVRITLPDETVVGQVTDVTTEGHLLVDVGACLRTIVAGDVVHLRG